MSISNEEMIEVQLLGRDITDERVISVMREVDRTLFVPDELKLKAYEDGPLPIGRGQTISQPYIVAYMAQALNLKGDEVVLEVGTGCGYNAAILSKLVKYVYSIEIIEWLADLGNENLANAKINNVSTKFGDGYQGWPEKAPFDVIMLTAAPPRIPDPLKRQLRIGGKLLAPVGDATQQLILLRKEDDGSFTQKNLLPVRFVPMTGEAQKDHL